MLPAQVWPEAQPIGQATCPEASESPQAPMLVDVPEQHLGPRVLARAYEEADAPALWEVLQESRAHLAPWMAWAARYANPTDAVGHLRRARARWLARQELTVGIFQRGSGRLLGESGLTSIDWHVRRFEIGYWIRPSAEGRGYVTETVQLLTRMAFERLDANRVEVRMDARNARSRAVAERLRFVLEGCLRRWHLDAAGRPQDLLVWSLTPEEYAALDWAHAGSRPALPICDDCPDER